MEGNTRLSPAPKHPLKFCFPKDSGRRCRFRVREHLIDCEPRGILTRTCHRIWLLDLAKRLPSATLDGYDISARQYPPNEWIPNNVKLHIVDATRDPPQHLQGYYDIVHIRLFLSIVENNNPSRILNHCLKLLSMYVIDRA